MEIDIHVGTFPHLWCNDVERLIDRSLDSTHWLNFHISIQEKNKQIPFSND